MKKNHVWKKLTETADKIVGGDGSAAFENKKYKNEIKKLIERNKKKGGKNGK